AAPAGKLLTRNAVSASSSMSTRFATSVGLDQVSPPSVDFANHVPSDVDSRVAPSQTAYTVPSAPVKTREPWSYRTLPEMDFGALNVRPPSLECASKMGDWT